MALSSKSGLPVEAAAVVRAVTTIMGTVVGLTFLFGFGNVLNLALRLGVPIWVAPLVAPAVDLSILGLLLGIRHLALAGVAAAQLQPARRLLMFASLVTLALNVAEPIVAGDYGKAAFDAVGPLLLIGWAEGGPGLLLAMATLPQATPSAAVESLSPREEAVVPVRMRVAVEPDDHESWMDLSRASMSSEAVGAARVGLIERARQEDAQHWAERRRPISADSLRKLLGIGAVRARVLVAEIRGGPPLNCPEQSVVGG